VPLQEYRGKRDFKKTPEPSGRVGKSETGRYFVIQKHAASRLHYDFRLELEGVLKSWAVPKGPCLDPSEKRLAVHVEDHPLDYGSFEGIIPQGEYGGGTVMVWDYGEWEPVGDPTAEYHAGRMKFILHGQKLQGGWALVRIKSREGGDEDNWLLFKEKDDEARPLNEFDILAEEPLSAASGRSIEEIAAAKPDTWSSNREQAGDGEKKRSRKKKTTDKAVAAIDAQKLTHAKPAVQPERFSPQLATLVKDIPRGDEWLHEIKFDGYRLISIVKEGKIHLWTRNGNDWSAKFPELVEVLRTLPVEQAILDGEIVVLDEHGISDFQALQNAIEGVREGRIIYYLFDMPQCQGYDIARAPILERKQLLKDIFDRRGTNSPVLRYSDHMRGHGPEFLEQACRYSLEGVVSKRYDSVYEQRRTRGWLKIKCVKRQEFVVGGYTEPGGSRMGFGALVLGYYDDSGGLIYCGRVGTGYTEKTLKFMTPELKSRELKENPFKKPPTGQDAKGVHYIRPDLVAEVEFNVWTKDGILRHPSFQGLRRDKDPRDVHREEPEAPPPSAEAPQEKPPPRKKGSSILIGGVSITNPDRVMFPGQGLTKRELALFYESIADWILPHIVERPLMVLRCPFGHEKECFHQKHMSETLPGQVYGIALQEGGETRQYIAIRDVPGLIALVQLGVLEIHPWGSKENDIERPDRLIFDLDPGPDVAHGAVVDAALVLRDVLRDLGLKSYLKTSGGKGYHVYSPVTSKISWDDIKEFAHGVAKSLVKESPAKYIATMSKAKRQGKIFIDYLRTGRGATCVAAYSTRAREGAPVSTPIDWDEINAVMPDSFNVGNLHERLKNLAQDPWEDFFKIRQGITARARKAVEKT
jgi:bifunctional non-homologous end joining protein LigD